MPDNTVDPSGNTEAFQAFTSSPREPETRSRTPLIVGGALVVAIVVALIVWLVS